MARKKNVTFNDIAQYTHFSKTTISRYFNNPDSLTPENQQIISDALDKLNYKENKVAKILANGQTEFVGVLISFTIFRQSASFFSIPANTPFSLKKDDNASSVRVSFPVK